MEPIRFFSLLLASFLLLFNNSVVFGSYGDNEYSFRRCFQTCSQECRKDPQHNANTYFPPFNTSLVSWSCPELCHYNCMNDITITRLQNNFEIYKYFGHWPFLRYFGLEEPASVLFSMLNAIPHLYNIPRWMSVKRSDYYMRNWIVLYSFVAINAWIASTIFHMKKEENTILYDYVSALLLLCTGFFLIIRRIGKAHMSTTSIGLILVAIFGLAGYRIYLMLAFRGLISFDYHLKTCIGIAAVTTVLWVYWIVSDNIPSGSGFLTRLRTCWSPAKKRAVLIQLWFVVASMFEIFDFPPLLRFLDAHSLWHALTIPLGMIFHEFWRIDQSEEDQSEAQNKAE